MLVLEGWDLGFPFLIMHEELKVLRTQCVVTCKSRKQAIHNIVLDPLKAVVGRQFLGLSSQ